MNTQISVSVFLALISYSLLVLATTVVYDGEGPENSSENVPDGRIIGGKKAKLGQFPYQALLSMVTDDGANANCGATLISNRHLLTAGHCSRFSTIKVTLGVIDSVSLTGPKSVSLTVNKPHIIRHPYFDKWNLINDIAILELPHPVNFSSDIMPAKLPKMSESSPDTFVGKEAVISGWGLTEYNTVVLEVFLRFAMVNVSQHFPCLEYYQLFNINDGTICTQYHGTGTCSGDSGGPMVLYHNGTNTHTLIGITSFGTTNCTDNAPSVFTNVAYYLPWIHNVTNITVT